MLVLSYMNSDGNDSSLETKVNGRLFGWIKLRKENKYNNNNEIIKEEEKNGNPEITSRVENTKQYRIRTGIREYVMDMYCGNG